MADACDVDQIWKSLGRFGKYQRRRLIVLLCSIWSCGFHVLSIVFIGFRPQYECTPAPGVNSTDSNVYQDLGKCSITTYVNDSGDVTTSETPCVHGYNYAIPDERSFVTEWDLVCSRGQLGELSQTLVMLGQAFGAIIFTSFADRYGRKPVHVGCHVILFAIALVTTFMPNYTAFAVMRFLTGSFQQGVGLTCAIISLEMFPREIRGYMEVLGLLFWTTGIAVVTPIAYLLRNVSWRYLQLTLSLLSSWALIEWWLLDESLRWLIANGKIGRAKEVLKRACKVNDKDYNEIATESGFRQVELQYLARKGKDGAQQELLADNTETMVNGDKKDAQNGDVVDEAKGTKTKRYTALDLLKTKRILISSLIMWFAWITNSVTYYGIMLISSSLAGNRFLNFFLGSIVEYPAALGEYLMINRYGRRFTAITFHAICGVSLIVATILTTKADGSSGMLLGSTVFTLVGKMAITGSFSTIFLYTPELYPTNMRNVGIGMSSTAARAGAMVAPFSRNLAEIALWAPGLIFGVMCAIVAVLMLWVPETNQYELPQTIEECEEWYRENQLKVCGRGKKERSEQRQLPRE